MNNFDEYKIYLLQEYYGIDIKGIKSPFILNSMLKKLESNNPSLKTYYNKENTSKLNNILVFDIDDNNKYFDIYLFEDAVHKLNKKIYKGTENLFATTKMKFLFRFDENSYKDEVFIDSFLEVLIDKFPEVIEKRLLKNEEYLEKRDIFNSKYTENIELFKKQFPTAVANNIDFSFSFLLKNNREWIESILFDDLEKLISKDEIFYLTKNSFKKEHWLEFIISYYNIYAEYIVVKKDNKVYSDKMLCNSINKNMFLFKNYMNVEVEEKDYIVFLGVRYSKYNFSKKTYPYKLKKDEFYNKLQEIKKEDE